MAQVLVGAKQLALRQLHACGRLQHKGIGSPAHRDALGDRGSGSVPVRKASLTAAGSLSYIQRLHGQTSHNDLMRHGE